MDRSGHEGRRSVLSVPEPHFGIQHLYVGQRQVVRAAEPRLARELGHGVLRGRQDHPVDQREELTFIARLLTQRLHAHDHPGRRDFRSEEHDASVLGLDPGLEAARQFRA